MRAAHVIPVFMFVIADGFGQFAPVPDSAFELGNGKSSSSELREQRDAAYALLRRAEGHFSLHRSNQAPFTIEVTFSALGPWAERGSGALEESWISPQQWRWTAHVGRYEQFRIFTEGAAYDEHPASAMPLPMQMIRNAIFGSFTPEQSVRLVDAKLKGTNLTCVLTGGDFPPRPPGTAGRRWEDSEYCIEPISGVLYMSSRAPGSYVLYDYSAVLTFHGQILPRKITFVENNAEVMEAALVTIRDAGPTKPGRFTPTMEMRVAGPQPLLINTAKLVQNIRSVAVKPGDLIPTIVVHAVLDMNGNVTEAEPLQSGAMSAAAVGVVKDSHYRPADGSGKVPPQRQAFITVHFMPATTADLSTASGPIGSLENGRYHHNLTGIEFTVPSGWKLLHESPSSGGGEIVVFADPRTGTSASVWMKPEGTAASTITQALASDMNRKHEDRGEGWVLRPGGSRPRVVGGQQALSATADIPEMPPNGSVELLTWVRSTTCRALVDGRARPGDLSILQDALDQIMNSASVP